LQNRNSKIANLNCCSQNLKYQIAKKNAYSTCHITVFVQSYGFMVQNQNLHITGLKSKLFITGGKPEFVYITGGKHILTSKNMQHTSQ